MPVPGVIAHEAMLPEGRKERLEAMKIHSEKARHAAVLMLLYPKNDQLYFALILRPTYEGVHSNQVALPGGKVEEEDASLSATALRETWEEIGILPEKIELISTLTKTYIPPSNFWVHPFLGCMDEYPVFIKQVEEVAEVIEVPVADLLDDKRLFSKKIKTSYTNTIKVPSFDLNGYTVWGATAMMLSELKLFLKPLNI